MICDKRVSILITYLKYLWKISNYKNIIIAFACKEKIIKKVDFAEEIFYVLVF